MVPQYLGNKELLNRKLTAFLASRTEGDRGRVPVIRLQNKVWRMMLRDYIVEHKLTDDFRNPPSGDPGFKWSCVSEDYMEWTPQQYRDMLYHPKAERQFHNDIEAMEACDTCVIVMPCGRSAHTEAGWFAGPRLAKYDG